MVQRKKHPASLKVEAALAAIKSELTQSQITSKYEIHTSQIAQWKKQAINSIKTTFTSKQSGVRDDVYYKQLTTKLYEQIGRLQMELDWLKKNLNLTIEEKRMLIEVNHSTISINRQYELVDLSRSSYYYKPKQCDENQLKLMQLIDERYTAYPTEGARRIAQWLQNLGYEVRRYQVGGLMKKMGIEAIYPKPNTSVPSRKPHEIYPYLLNEMEVNTPNHVWCTDITYVRLKGGFVYLTAIMDWYSRYVIAWELSTTLDSQFCLLALERALRHGRCEIMNSDQGSQYTSRDWIDLLKSHHISISMDGKGRCYDNIFVERLWRTVKYECIYLKDFDSPKEIHQALEKYFDYYNHERLHQSLDYRTPYNLYSEEKLK